MLTFVTVQSILRNVFVAATPNVPQEDDLRNMAVAQLKSYLVGRNLVRIEAFFFTRNQLFCGWHLVANWRNRVLDVEKDCQWV